MNYRKPEVFSLISTIYGLLEKFGFKNKAGAEGVEMLFDDQEPYFLYDHGLIPSGNALDKLYRVRVLSKPGQYVDGVEVKVSDVRFGGESQLKGGAWHLQ